MMVKISVIFMSFSNPTCHFRDTAEFTPLQYLGGKVSYAKIDKIFTVYLTLCSKCQIDGGDFVNS